MHFESKTWNIAPFCNGRKLIMMHSPFKQVGIREKWSTSNNPLACTGGAYCGFKMSLSWKWPDHYQFDIWKFCFYRTLNLSYQHNIISYDSYGPYDMLLFIKIQTRLKQGRSRMFATNMIRPYNDCTVGYLKWPKKYVEELFFTWWHLHKFLKCPKIEQFQFFLFSIRKLITCLIFEMSHFRNIGSIRTNMDSNMGHFQNFELEKVGNFKN